MTEETANRKPTPQRITFTPVNTIAMVAAVLAAPGAVICLKLSSQEWANKLQWWDAAFWMAIAYFALGNVVGFTTTVGKTIALRDNPPNLVYSFVGAPSSIILHLVLAGYFKTSLTAVQWLAIGIIVFGAILLQWGPVPREEEVIAEVIQHLEGEEEEEGEQLK